MKTRYIKGVFLLLLTICIAHYAHADEAELIKEQIVINMEQAGTLHVKIGLSKRNVITNLKLIGPINGKDIEMLREMAGGGIEIRATNGSLETLDLQDAIVVDGGTYSYYDTNTHAAASAYSRNNVIGVYAFSRCKHLKSVSLPQTTTIIKSHAFSECENLKELKVSPSIESIEDNAFNGCCSLLSISLPENISKIEDFAFAGCSSLSKIEVHNTNVPLLGKDVFSGTTRNQLRLLVPKGTHNKYWLSSWGDNITDIIENNNDIGKNYKNKR